MNLFPITKVNFKESPQFLTDQMTVYMTINVTDVNDNYNDGNYGTIDS